jgi:hypothetical protein
MTYTPDSLRALKRLLLRIGLNKWEAEQLDACADAWGADNYAHAVEIAAKDVLIAALREQADVDRSFIEQYQREVAALRKDIEAEALAHQGTIESWMAESKAMHDEYAALNKRLEEAETGRKTDAELLFQAGCVFALSENPVPAVRMFERAKKLGHPDAEEQLVALAGEDGDV